MNSAFALFATLPNSRALLAAFVLVASGLSLCCPLAALGAVTTYSGVFAGGTIAPGNTVVLINGASVSGGVVVNGSLQVDQSGTNLVIPSVISGTGTLNLTNTGTLTLNGTSALSFLPELAMNYTTTINAGKLVGLSSATSSLVVGYGGTGTLNVNGGAASAQAVLLGGPFWSSVTAGVGNATVSSGTLEIIDTFVVGNTGSGSLTVAGGSVTSRWSFIGYSGGSVGAAAVSSGTWANSRDLMVGGNGNGTLTMTGGLVVVGGTLSKNNASTINLNAGGTLQIGVGGTTGALLGGTGSLINNGTVVFNRSDASIYSGVLSGSGAVTKQGTGNLTFSGANTYAGLTTISAGTISLSGSGKVGTGGLNLGTVGSPGVFSIAGLVSGSYVLPSVASLSGVGTVSGSGKSLAVLGVLVPGSAGAGTVTVGSGLMLDLVASGSSVFEINSPTYAAGTFDLINGSGSVAFGGVLNLAFSGGPYADGTNVLQIFANAGGRTGNFSAVNATGLAAGQFATFNPATGFISVVPEPSTYVMALAGLACGGYSIRRRRKQA